MTIKIKHLILSLVVIGLGIGIYFLVNFLIQLNNSVIAIKYGQADVVNFIHQEFPDQVKAYIDAMNKTLPTNPTKK